MQEGRCSSAGAGVRVQQCARSNMAGMQVQVVSCSLLGLRPYLDRELPKIWLFHLHLRVHVPDCSNPAALCGALSITGGFGAGWAPPSPFFQGWGPVLPFFQAMVEGRKSPRSHSSRNRWVCICGLFHGGRSLHGSEAEALCPPRHLEHTGSRGSSTLTCCGNSSVWKAL